MLLGVVAAVAPARAALALDVVTALKGLRSNARHGRRLGTMLVGAQMCAAVMLLVGAAVLVRIPARVASDPPRFEMRQVRMPNLVPADRTGTPNAWNGYHDELAAALRELPAVEAVAFGSAPPANDERVGSVVVTPAGQARRELPSVQVSANYFAVFGIPILRGRAIAAGDTACVSGVCSVVVSREVGAARLNENHGKRLRC